MPNPEVAIIIRGIDRATGAFKSISKAGTTAFKRIGQASAVAAAALAGVGVAYGALIQSGIQYNAQMERYQATLETTMKSQSKAVEQLVWARKFAAETPFQIPEIVEATVRLETYGLRSREVLKTIGDMAAIMGKPLMQAIEAIADAQTGEMERLKEFGITKRMLIREGMKVTSREQISDFKQMNDVLFRLMETRFAGGMQKMMVGFTGMVSNLRDAWSSILGELAQPMFEAVKAELKTLLDWIAKIQTEGRLGRILTDWGEAGRRAFLLISSALKAVGPELLKAIQNAGQAVNEFIGSLKPESIKRFAKSVGDFTKTVITFTGEVVKTAYELKLLIAAFAGLVIISKIAVSVLAFSKAIIAAKAVVVKFAAAHTSLMAAMGPVGAALVAGGAIFMAIKSYRDSVKEAREETEKLRKEFIQMRIDKLTAEVKSGAEKWKVLTDEISKYQRWLRMAEVGQWKMGQALLAGTITQKEYNQFIEDSNINIEMHKRKIAALERERRKYIKAIQDEVAAAKEAREAPPAPPPEAVVSPEIIQLRTDLNRELEKLTLDEIQFEKNEVERWYAEKKELAKDDEQALRKLAEIREAKLLAIDKRVQQEIQKNVEERRKEIQTQQEERVKAHFDATTELLRLQGKETLVAERMAFKRARDIFEQTRDAVLANQVYQAELQKMRDQEAINVKAKEQEKWGIKEELRVKTLQAEGREREAALAMLDKEIVEWSRRGAAFVDLEAFQRTERARINAEFDEKERAEQRKKIEQIRQSELQLKNEITSGRMDQFQQAIFQMEQEAAKYKEMGIQKSLIDEWKAAQTLAIKEEEARRILDMETQNLNQMKAAYQTYANLVLNIGEAIFSQQEGGWLRALASLTRFGAKVLSTYLMRRAQEKLQDKAQAETHAKWLRYHAEKMAALAAEYQAMAAARLAMGDIAGALAAQKAVVGYVAAGASDLALAAKAEAEAVKLGLEARKEMVAAVAAQAAGEIAVSEIERRARTQQEAAREQQRLQQEREAELRAIQPSQAITAAQERMEQVQAQPEIRREAPMMRVIAAPQQVNIYQTVYIDGWVNTADEAHLRKLATDILPYNEEVQKTFRSA